GFGPPPAAPGGFGPPPGPPPSPGGFGPPPGAPPSPPKFGPPPAAGGGFGPPPAAPSGGFGPPPMAPREPSGAFGPPPAAPPLQSSPNVQPSSPADLNAYSDGLRMIAIELRGIAASKTIFSTQILPSPKPGVAAVAIRYGRSMHVICAGGPFSQPIWPSRDFADRDKLLAATIGNDAGAELMIPWVLTYVMPGVYPDLGKDEASKQAFVEAADAFGVGVDQAGIDAARRQGFPEVTRNHARFLVVSEPKQSIAGIELRWGDRPFEMLYVPTPGVVARSAPWT
ncbi:MAG: hypothetical protein ACXWP4_18055, partial [Polyangiales bacterium]